MTWAERRTAFPTAQALKNGCRKRIYAFRSLRYIAFLRVSDSAPSVLPAGKTPPPKGGGKEAARIYTCPTFRILGIDFQMNGRMWSSRPTVWMLDIVKNGYCDIMKIYSERRVII